MVPSKEYMGFICYPCHIIDPEEIKTAPTEKGYEVRSVVIIILH